VLSVLPSVLDTPARSPPGPMGLSCPLPVAKAGMWRRAYAPIQPLFLILDDPTAASRRRTKPNTRCSNATPLLPRARTPADEINHPVLPSLLDVRMANLIVVRDGSRRAGIGTHYDLCQALASMRKLYGIQAAAYRWTRAALSALSPTPPPSPQWAYRRVTSACMAPGRVGWVANRLSHFPDMAFRFAIDSTIFIVPPFSAR